jgi:hypothetical protein
LSNSRNWVRPRFWEWSVLNRWSLKPNGSLRISAEKGRRVEKWRGVWDWKTSVRWNAWERWCDKWGGEVGELEMGCRWSSVSDRQRECLLRSLLAMEGSAITSLHLCFVHLM